MRIFHFLATSFFAHLPLQLGNTASRASATHEADGRVAYLNLIGNIQHLNLRIELPGLAERGVLFVHHHVSRSWHVVFVQAFDVQSDIVAWVREVDAGVVHFHCENLASAWIRGGVGWQENHFLTRFNLALFDTSSQHVTDALNLPM